MLYYTHYIAPIGRLLLAATDNRLCYLALPGLEHNFSRFAHKYFPGVKPTENAAALQAVMTQLDQYFAGRRTSFELPLDLHATDFSRAVLAQVSAIPYGRTTSYGAIARQIGRPGAARAVGRANATNPLPLVIPCHRVLDSRGRLNGYAGGLETKATLLRLEGVHV